MRSSFQSIAWAGSPNPRRETGWRDHGVRAEVVVVGPADDGKGIS